MTETESLRIEDETDSNRATRRSFLKFFGAAGGAAVGLSSVGDVRATDQRGDQRATAAPDEIVYETVTAGKLRQLASSLASHKIVSIDGHERNNAASQRHENAFNVVFRPADGVPWSYSLLPRSLGSTVENMKNDDFRPVHLDSFRTAENSVGYAVVFEKASGLWRYSYGASGDTHQRRFDKWTKEDGYRPVNASVVSINGTRHYTALYEKRDVGNYWMKSTIPESEYQAAFDLNLGANPKRFPVYLKVYEHAGDIYYSAIFHSKPNYRSFSARHRINYSTYLAKKNELTQKGPYLTRSVTSYFFPVAGDTVPSSIWGAIWERPL